MLVLVQLHNMWPPQKRCHPHGCVATRRLFVRVHFLGVCVARALLFWVYIGVRPPDFWKLPHPDVYGQGFGTVAVNHGFPNTTPQKFPLNSPSLVLNKLQAEPRRGGSWGTHEFMLEPLIFGNSQPGFTSSAPAKLTHCEAWGRPRK